MRAGVSPRTVGLTAVPVAGLCFLTSVALRGGVPDPSADAAAFARSASEPMWAPAWLLAMAGAAAMVPGLLSLCAIGSRARIAGTGLVLSLVGLLLVTPLFAFMAIVAPVVARQYLSGDATAADVAAALLAEPQGLVLLTSSGFAYTAGSLLVAIGFWRPGFAPSAAAVAYTMHAPLLAFAIGPVFEAVGALLLIVAGGVTLRLAHPPSPAGPAILTGSRSSVPPD